MYRHMVVLVLLMLLLRLTNQMKIGRFGMNMPSVSPNKPEQYLCTPVKVGNKKYNTLTESFVARFIFSIIPRLYCTFTG